MKHRKAGKDYFFSLSFYLLFFLFLFLASGGGSTLYPEFLQYETMILQRPRIIVGDSGFEPGTSASEVWRATLLEQPWK